MFQSSRDLHPLCFDELLSHTCIHCTISRVAFDPDPELLLMIRKLMSAQHTVLA